VRNPTNESLSKQQQQQQQQQQHLNKTSVWYLRQCPADLDRLIPSSILPPFGDHIHSIDSTPTPTTQQQQFMSTTIDNNNNNNNNNNHNQTCM
jgi:hypothetical protein